MRGRAVWALVSATSVLLVTAVASAQCSKDTDCKGDRVCEAGKCTSPGLPPAPPAPPGSETPAAAAPPPASDPHAPPPAADPAPPAEPAPAATAPPPANLQLAPLAPAEAPLAGTVPPPDDQPQMRRRNRNMMLLGVAMVSVGPIALLGALAAKNGQERCDTKLQNDYPDHRLPPSEHYREDECNDYSVPLYVFGIGGIALTAVGIPLIVYGAKQVPLNRPQATLRVLPWASPDSGGVRLRLEL